MDFNDFNFEETKTERKSTEILDDIKTSIEIYVKQRNGRKCITTVEGLGNDKDKLKNISKQLRKKMSCSGTVDKNKETGKMFLKFSGQDINTIVNYLVKINYSKEDIRIHGV